MRQGKTKIMIVEDDVLVADNLYRFLENKGYAPLEPVSGYEEAVMLLKEHQPDLALLDIRLAGEKSGIDFARYLNESKSCPFIFITSHLDPRTLQDAKGTAPSGYLVKPFQPETLYTTIEIVLYNLKQTAGRDTTILLKNGTQTEKINIDELLFAEADGSYVHLVLKNRRILFRRNLKEMLEELPFDRIIQVHRSYAINISRLIALGTDKAILDGAQVPVSKTYRDLLQSRFAG